MKGSLGHKGVFQVLSQNIDAPPFVIKGTPQVLELTDPVARHLQQPTATAQSFGIFAS
ncbi:MAG: hypothetical protein HP494_17505 [Nitrospira sp.]|nr:hypothetical protein [Nitrospira sp.]